MFSEKRIAVICNAPIVDYPKIRQRILNYPRLIAVDGGLNHCDRMGLKPHLLLGDFDSADPAILSKFSSVPQIRHPEEKDQTDLELALAKVYDPQIEEIAVFGALNGRIDHALGNLILLTRYPGKMVLESENERVFVIDKSIEFASYLGQVISLIPLNGPAVGIQTKGLKWELDGRTLDKHFIGISNEATEQKVSISVEKGRSSVLY